MIQAAKSGELRLHMLLCACPGRAEKLRMKEFIKSSHANITGLSALSTEILLNIMSHFRCIPVPFTELYPGYVPPQYLERLEALQALSRAC